MSKKTLYLAWQAKQNRGWFPIGQLDVDADASDHYRFRYTEGAKRAQQEGGFSALMEFPDIDVPYGSDVLFPTFANRIMSKSRPDFAKYMHSLGLDETLDPIESLHVNGGHRVTDAYEIFPKIERQVDGRFVCRFFLHGDRHTNLNVTERIKELKVGENLCVALQLNNPATGLAVQIQTKDYYMIGWSPRYLAHDLAAAMIDTTIMDEPDTEFKAHVVRVNPQPAPSSHRVLIEFSGCWDWDKHEPMSSDDFKPLVDG